MDFTTCTFWLIMLPSMAVIYLVNQLEERTIRRARYTKSCLLLLSLTLLYTASTETLLIFLFVTILAYFGCIYARKTENIKRNIILIFLIIILLIPLTYYKYANFITRDVMSLPWDTFRDLVIPIGISFYSFQTIAFCIDTLKRNQEIPTFIDYMNFCSFFPQIVAGPIERRDSLLPQVTNLHLKWDSSNTAQGIFYIILGLFFKMVLGDNLATAMHIGYDGHNAFQVWVNNIAFGFRIYFDFAGYGLTAYGISKALGINITLNFMSPYTCCNVTDFWRKWHISLTTWFRDYIYFSLGGSRTRFWFFNIVFMFLISGIWHGAGWNFIIWGTMAGVTMVIHRIYRQSGHTLPSFIGWGITICTMMFIWMFFYETNMSIVYSNLLTVLSPSAYDAGDFITLMQNNAFQASHLIVFCFLSIVVIFLEYISIRKYGHPYQILLNPAACGCMLLLIFMLHSQQKSQFIYFAF